MSAKLGAAILGITHFTKGSEGRAPIDRVAGSVAFGALARVVMIAAREHDGDDGKPGPRVLMRAKSNIGPDDGGLITSCN
jgi:putative DNA primase/helicase